MQSADIAKLIFPRIDIIEMDALADEQMAKACNAPDLPSYADPANILALEDRPSGFAEIGSGRFNRAAAAIDAVHENGARSEEQTSELQSLMLISYAGFCLKKKQK